MLASFRRLSKSKIGTAILVAFLLAILASFVIADIGQIRSTGFGSSGGPVEVGSEAVSEREISRAMDRVLSNVRQQNPDAQMRDVIADYDEVVRLLTQQLAVTAFADDTGMALSKRLVDAEIANLPSVKGLDGKFSEAAYAQFLQSERLTDSEVRKDLRSSLLQRMILSPAAANTRVATGVAMPYASALLEERTGEFAMIPTPLFRAGLNPGDAELQAFYAANRARYTIPEQRVLRYAKIGPEAVAGATATPKEIADYYNANRDSYAGKEIRVISQAVVQDQATAKAIADRARGGAAFTAAAAPAGLTAADVSVGPQSRADFTALAGDKVAAAAFAALAGEVVGPVQSDLGWHVVKIDSVRSEAGRSLAAASAEIAAKLNADKRKDAMADLIANIEDEVDGGASFPEVVAKYKLPVVETPALTASGQARSQPGFTPSPEVAALLKYGFDLAADDKPVVETLPNESGYALLTLGQVVPAAPPPLAAIREQVRGDWIQREASNRAKAAATAVAAKAGKGVALAEAMKGGTVALPPPQTVTLRRVQLAQAERASPALVMLFKMAPGQSRMVAAPDNAGYFVVQVKKATPGSASLVPALAARTQAEIGQAVGREYAEQFIRAIQAELGVKRDEAALARLKQQLAGSGS